MNDISIRVRRAASIVATGLALTLFASAPSQAAAKIQRLVSPGGIEAWFVQDATVPLIAMEYAFRGSLRMLKDDKDEAFGLLQLALTSARFDDADVERIRAQVISGLRRDTTNPSSLASRKFLEVAFGDHPYGRQSYGTLDSVPGINVSDMKAYVGRILARDTLRISVVGDIDAD